MAEIQNAPTSAFPARPSLAELQAAPTGGLPRPSLAEIEAAPTAAFPRRPSLAETEVAPTADAPIPSLTPPAPRTPPVAAMSPAASLSDAFPDSSSLGRVALEQISPAELAERQADELTNTTGASLAAVEDPETVVTPGTARPSKPRRTLPATAAAKGPPLPVKTLVMIGAPVALVVLAGLTWALWPRGAPKPVPPTVVEIPLPPEPAPVAEVPVAEPEPEPVAAPEPAPALLLGGKPIVLEYDEGPPAVTPAGANAAAIAKARDASRKGSARLAAGDKKGALKLQRAALKFYPGYLGAYRGLGKALATGDKNEKKTAVKVLTVYVKAAPEAEDVAAITQLIDKLGKKAPARRR